MNFDLSVPDSSYLIESEESTDRAASPPVEDVELSPGDANDQIICSYSKEPSPINSRKRPLLEAPPKSLGAIDFDLLATPPTFPAFAACANSYTGPVRDRAVAPPQYHNDCNSDHTMVHGEDDHAEGLEMIQAMDDLDAIMQDQDDGHVSPPLSPETKRLRTMLAGIPTDQDVLFNDAFATGGNSTGATGVYEPPLIPQGYACTHPDSVRPPTPPNLFAHRGGGNAGLYEPPLLSQEYVPRPFAPAPPAPPAPPTEPAARGPPGIFSDCGGIAGWMAMHAKHARPKAAGGKAVWVD
ncbi:MAG: hypothetical protein ACKVI4_14660 [Actinomycetales bacterium]|tara:strand:- start:57 stop:944 length:888 start_codon:yes stop_codon:yes gene_type:complete